MLSAILEVKAKRVNLHSLSLSVSFSEPYTLVGFVFRIKPYNITKLAYTHTYIASWTFFLKLLSKLFHTLEKMFGQFLTPIPHVRI